MAGDSLANTLNFLQTQLGGQRQIPEASPEFLASAQNPNIRNFGPGQEPQFQSPVLQMLMGAPGKGANSLAGSLAGVGVSPGNDVLPAGTAPGISPQQGGKGAMAGLMRMLGLGNVGDPLAGRQQTIDDILKQSQ